jgi:hypothetical protein
MKCKYNSLIECDFDSINQVRTDCRSFDCEQYEQSQNKLPIFKIGTENYFWDRQLYQYRNVNNPHDILDGNMVDDSDIKVELIELNNGNI